MTFDREHGEDNGRKATSPEHDDMALAERIFILHEAGSELAETYLEGREEDEPAPADLDQAVWYAVNLLYKTGAVVSHVDDISRTIEDDINARELDHGDDSWKPGKQDEELVTDLFLTGTLLSASDNTPAFRSHPSGRNFEAIDGPDSQYNKYGRLVSNSTASRS